MSGGNGRAAVMGDAVSGVAAEIAGAHAAADGDQLPMFEVPTRHTGARADALQTAIDVKRSRGRPPGAVNKSTKAFRDWLLARGKHPLQWMMEFSLHTPTSLAAELGCTRLEAFDRLASIADKLAPYFAAKMVPVDDQGRPVPMFMMQFGQFNAPEGHSSIAPWLRGESQQNQALLEPERAVSDGSVSDGEAK